MTDVRYSHLAVERVTPQFWRVTFDHGPINTITADTVAELSRLVDAIEQDDDLTVVVFTSRNPEFFLAHYDTQGDPAKTVSMPPGPTGMHPWLDLTARLSRAPVVSIASLRGRARGAGSEFALACDIRLAGDKAILAQFEVGTGVVPGGGPMARLPRLIGRGRALEVLLVADDIDAALAERYGYSTASCPTTSSSRRPTASRAAWRPSTGRRSRRPSPSSMRPACPTTRSCRPVSTRSSPRRGALRPGRGRRRWPRTGSEATASWSVDWASWSRSPPDRPTRPQRQEAAA
jgi:enoyl-CoA hydratase/carnithine racemase